jgi:hypothetical protein
VVTSALGGQTGVRLPVITTPVGLRVVIVNDQNLNTLNVFPASGAKIDAAAVDTAVLLPVGATATYEAVNSTYWYTVNPPVVADASLTVTYGNGKTTVGINGPVSIANGGTDSGTALSGSSIMISDGTHIVQGALGTATTLLHGNAGGAPTYSAVTLTTDVTGILPIANGGTASSTALSGTTIMVASGGSIVQGSAGTGTTVLHGNAAGLPTYSAVVLTTDVSGILPVANGGTAGTNTINTINSIAATAGQDFGITGTALEVTVTAATHGVTLSIPNTFLAPGTIQDTSGMRYSAQVAISAAGTTQGTATVLTKSFNVITSVTAGNTGVVLPTPAAGLRVVVLSEVGDIPGILSVYPPSGVTIDQALANIPVTLAPGACATYQGFNSVEWFTVDAPVVADASLTVTYGNGKTTVGINGPVSPANGGTGSTNTINTINGIAATAGQDFAITGTALEVTVTAATNGVVLSLPNAVTAPGSITATSTIIDGSGMCYSTSNALTAAGSTISDALPLTKSYNVISTAATSAKGVALPSAVVGMRVVVVSLPTVASVFNVYPKNGDSAQIDAAGTNGAVTLAIGATATYEAVTTTQWYTVNPPVVAGTGISVTAGNGKVTIAATTAGVTSVAGTTNQVTVSPTTGNAVVSLPNAITAPGSILATTTIQDGSGMRYSTTTGISAGSAGQATATALTTSFNVVSTAGSTGLGVALPTAVTGLRVVIVNNGANTINVFPVNGGSAQIDAAGANTAVTLAVSTTVTYEAASATQWYTVDPPIVAGTGISVTPGNGGTTIASTVTLATAVKSVVFTSGASTWTIPASTSYLRFTLIGGGGGGGPGQTSGVGAGGGGGSGNMITNFVVPANGLGSSLTYSVGAAGAGAILGTSAATAGQPSTVNIGSGSLTARGGGGCLATPAAGVGFGGGAGAGAGVAGGSAVGQTGGVGGGTGSCTPASYCIYGVSGADGGLGGSNANGAVGGTAIGEVGITPGAGGGGGGGNGHDGGVGGASLQNFAGGAAGVHSSFSSGGGGGAGGFGGVGGAGGTAPGGNGGSAPTANTGAGGGGGASNNGGTAGNGGNGSAGLIIIEYF